MEAGHPKSIGKYEIQSVIGRGGMGVVYRAQDPMMGRQVAIKTVTHGLSSDAGMLQRFYGEAEKMGMLRHPNIITVYDLGEHHGFPYIVMEFVEGDPLDRVIESGRAVSLFDKLRIIEQVCSALGYAHRSQVVHRDVKPANVIVRPDGVAKLLDFGIARQESSVTDRDLTDPHGVIGTIAYMAPERLRGAVFDGRSDIFSTGVLLFQLLAGHLPFPGKEFVLVNQILNDPHPQLREFIQEYPAALDMVLDRSLAKNASDRYQAADEMAADLYSVIEMLREQSSMELLARAEALSSTGDFIGAQNALYGLLKIDSRNPQARMMMKELGVRISEKARAAQVEVLQRQAEGALRERDFDQAIQKLEDADRLVPGDIRVAAQLEEARSKKLISDRILGYLQEADRAKRQGDFTGARIIVEKAIELDTGNSRLRSAYQALVRQADAAATQAKLTAVLDSVREAISCKNYQAAVDLTDAAWPLHGNSLDLQELLQTAKEALQEQRRRGVIEELEDRAANAVTMEDAETAMRLVQQSLETFPADATLLRLRAQIVHTLQGHRTALLVDEALKQCAATLKTAPLAALDTVGKALLEAPGDERLLALEGRIRQHISRLSVEETRAAVLGRANDALTARDYPLAVSVLAQCVAPVLTPEIDELLEYAREQVHLEERMHLIARCYAEAQALLRADEYRKCVALLGSVVEMTDDPRLRATMEEAQSKLDELSAEEAAALALIRPYVEAGCHEQVIAIVRGLPERTSMTAEVKALRMASDEAWLEEGAQLEALGRAYAGLSCEEPELLAIAIGPVPKSKELRTLQHAFIKRRTSVADALVTSNIDQLRQNKNGMTNIDSGTCMDAGTALLPFVSEAVRVTWASTAEVHQKTSKSLKILGRLGKKQTK